MARILLDNNEWAVKDDLSFFNISSEIIDLTDGTWTLLDPDSLVQSTSFASGFNTITWNALGAGSNDYVWTISTTHRAPRWYKLLKIDGNQITSDDFITFQANGKLDTSVLDFNHQIVYGICSDPTSTTAGTIDGAGALMSQNTTAQPKHGIWAENLRSENASNADNISQAAVLQRGKGMMIGGVSVSIDSSGRNLLNTSLRINKGDFVLIYGDNAVGKSLLLRLKKNT